MLLESAFPQGVFFPSPARHSYPLPDKKSIIPGMIDVKQEKIFVRLFGFLDFFQGQAVYILPGEKNDFGF
jgi:hypothetical protein